MIEFASFLIAIAVSAPTAWNHWCNAKVLHDLDGLSVNEHTALQQLFVAPTSSRYNSISRWDDRGGNEADDRVKAGIRSLCRKGIIRRVSPMPIYKLAARFEEVISRWRADFLNCNAKS